MKKLSEETGMTYDGGDDRLFYDEERIYVDVTKMDEADYDRMEKEMENAEIKTTDYVVYAWNDASGYEYWKKQSETGDFNYIQVSVAVKNPGKADASKMISDVQRVHDKLSGWNSAY